MTIMPTIDPNTLIWRPFKWPSL